MKEIYYEIASTDSTNATAKKGISLWDPYALTVVTTREQTAGKGKFGRYWHSTDRDILASFCFFLCVDSVDSALLFRIGTEAVIRLGASLGIPGAVMKWPNDVLVLGKKLSGVLCETVPVDKGLFVIIGIGVNGNVCADELLVIDQPATSLQELIGESLDMEEQVYQLAKEIKYLIQELPLWGSK
jgi:Biotin-(acetyl-CoA carboxylase) ligase